GSIAFRLSPSPFSCNNLPVDGTSACGSSYTSSAISMPLSLMHSSVSSTVTLPIEVMTCFFATADTNSSRKVHLPASSLFFLASFLPHSSILYLVSCSFSCTYSSFCSQVMAISGGSSSSRCCLGCP